MSPDRWTNLSRVDVQEFDELRDPLASPHHPPGLLELGQVGQHVRGNQLNLKEVFFKILVILNPIALTETGFLRIFS